MSAQRLDLQVVGVRLQARDVVSIELRDPHGHDLPAFEPGAHIDLHLPGGLVRSYSLVNAPEQRDHYLVAVLRDRSSRGGSVWIHDHLRVGQVLPVDPPRNHFPLHEAAGRSVLIAGGIGVTPLVCMARRLSERGSPVRMLYAARSRECAAFGAELRALGIPVRWHFDDVQGGPPDLEAFVRDCASDTHLYACGPHALLESFQATCERLGLGHRHIERFGAPPTPAATADDARDRYIVELRRSGRELQVRPGQSLLDVLRDADVDVPFSCTQGVCGSCETAVLEGVPDHRDHLLSEREKAGGRTMLVCVSGCRSERLVLDL